MKTIDNKFDLENVNSELMHSTNNNEILTNIYHKKSHCKSKSLNKSNNLSDSNSNCKDSILDQTDKKVNLVSLKIVEDSNIKESQYKSLLKQFFDMSEKLNLLESMQNELKKSKCRLQKENSHLKEKINGLILQLQFKEEEKSDLKKKIDEDFIQISSLLKESSSFMANKILLEQSLKEKDQLLEKMFFFLSKLSNNLNYKKDYTKSHNLDKDLFLLEKQILQREKLINNFKEKIYSFSSELFLESMSFNIIQSKKVNISFGGNETIDSKKLINHKFQIKPQLKQKLNQSCKLLQNNDENDKNTKEEKQDKLNQIEKKILNLTNKSDSKNGKNPFNQSTTHGSINNISQPSETLINLNSSKDFNNIGFSHNKNLSNGNFDNNFNTSSSSLYKSNICQYKSRPSSSLNFLQPTFKEKDKSVNFTSEQYKENNLKKEMFNELLSPANIKDKLKIDFPYDSLTSKTQNLANNTTEPSESNLSNLNKYLNLKVKNSHSENRILTDYSNHNQKTKPIKPSAFNFKRMANQ